jgi:predicted ATPase
MITLVEALRFRCLRYVRQPLGRFHVLVGPNASGKTTFLDVPALLGRLVSDGLDAAIRERTQNLEDLFWRRDGTSFELAIEARIPEEKRTHLQNKSMDTLRYEVAIGLDPGTQEFIILSEKVLLKVGTAPAARQSGIFPAENALPTTILTAKHTKKTRVVINKTENGIGGFHEETSNGWVRAFKVGTRRSALANLPEDEAKFPISAWFKNFLSEGIRQLSLNGSLLRKASPPGLHRGFVPDGSNLPWVVADLQDLGPEFAGALHQPRRLRSDRVKKDFLEDWVSHLRTALPDLESVRTVERPDDKHRYVVLRYAGGLDVPSWMASDGTLRLMALTLPAYLPGLTGVYLIEEPENGVHPRAVETMFQSLSSVYNAQILLATHSPVILSLVDPADLLCFAKTAEGATDIVSGKEHPALRDWRGEVNLSDLFAGGVLG